MNPEIRQELNDLKKRLRLSESLFAGKANTEFQLIKRLRSSMENPEDHEELDVSFDAVVRAFQQAEATANAESWAQNGSLESPPSASMPEHLKELIKTEARERALRKYGDADANPPSVNKPFAELIFLRAENEFQAIQSTKVQEIRKLIRSARTEKYAEPSQQGLDGPYACAFFGSRCTWRGSLKADIMKHLKEKHKNIATAQGKNFVFLATGIHLSGDVNWAMRQECFDTDFMMVLKKQASPSNPLLYGVVQCFGPEMEADKYVYKFELSGNEKTKTWKATPRSMQKGIEFASDCFTLNEEEVNIFADNGKLAIKVYIAQKDGEANSAQGGSQTPTSSNTTEDKQDCGEEKGAEKKAEKEELERQKVSNEVDPNVAIIDSLSKELEGLKVTQNEAQSENEKLKLEARRAEETIQALKNNAEVEKKEKKELKEENWKLEKENIFLTKQNKSDNDRLRNAERLREEFNDSKHDSEIKIHSLTLRLQDAEKLLFDLRQKVQMETERNGELKKNNEVLLIENDELKTSNALMNSSINELKTILFGNQQYYEMGEKQSERRIQELNLQLNHAQSQLEWMKEKLEAEANINDELKKEIKALNEKMENKEKSHESTVDNVRFQVHTLTVAIKNLNDQLTDSAEKLKRTEAIIAATAIQNRLVIHDVKQREIVKKAEQDKLTEELESSQMESILLRNQITCLKKELKESKDTSEKKVGEMKVKLLVQSKILEEFLMKMEKEKEEEEELAQDGYEVFEF